MIYLGSSGENRDKNSYKTCPKCSSAFHVARAPTANCCTCKSYYPKGNGRTLRWLTKSGIILATIVIDIILLLASGFLGAAVLEAKDLALGILATPIVMGMFCYVIGGNKVTYKFLNSVSRYAQKIEEDGKVDWEPARRALKGDGFMVGVVLFFIFTFIILIVAIASQIGGVESFSGLVKVIMIIMLFVVVFPVSGFVAKKLGNEKAAAELGYTSFNGMFLAGGKNQADESSSTTNGGGDGSGGDGSFSF